MRGRMRQTEKLTARLGVVAKQAAHAGRDRARTLLLHAAHHAAQVLTLDHHANPLRPFPALRLPDDASIARYTPEEAALVVRDNLRNRSTIQRALLHALGHARHDLVHGLRRHEKPARKLG